MLKPEDREPSPQPPRWRRRLQGPLLAFAAIAIPLAAWRIADSAPRAFGVSGVPTPRHLMEPEFDLAELRLPREAVLSGGPRKDVIPALTAPASVPASKAGFVADGDEVIGVVFDGEARAYPLAILDHHEVVNDAIGGATIAVTYCPLCDSSVVFDRQGAGGADEFGVSGLLYNSNVLMFDRREEGAESLWTQMGSVAVSGPAADRPLRRLPCEVATWASWRERHPETTVLSIETGYHGRSYNRTVYAPYFESQGLMFPAGDLDERLSAKTPVLGVTSGGQTRAYTWGTPVPEARHERLGEAEFDLVADPADGRLRIENLRGEAEWCYAFWFAWSAFNPETALVGAKPESLDLPLDPPAGG